MEPVKFEEHIKEQLQRREIKPSAESWEKLQGRLEQKKAGPKKTIFWLGLAAAFAGIFFLAGTFFSNPFIETDPAVVEQSSEAPVKLKKEKVAPAPAPEELNLIASEEIIIDEAAKPETLAVGAGKGKTALSPVAENMMKPQPVPEEPAMSELALVKERLSNEHPEVLAAVSDAEIDALLLLAEVEMTELPKDYSSASIDPEVLLSEVESELDHSFREKILELIKGGLSKAKTAVANRNF